MRSWDTTRGLHHGHFFGTAACPLGMVWHGMAWHGVHAVGSEWVSFYFFCVACLSLVLSFLLLVRCFALRACMAWASGGWWGFTAVGGRRGLERSYGWMEQGKLGHWNGN